MSTLSFQDYVRTRMLKKRREAIDAAAAPRKGAGATSIAGHHIDFSVDDGESPVERSATPSEIYAAATAAASVRRRRPHARALCRGAHRRPRAAHDRPRRHGTRRRRPARTVHRRRPDPRRHGRQLRRCRRAARSPRDDGRAAFDEGPDRGALRRPRLHGEAAAPAGRGTPVAETARLRLLAGADPQDRRRPLRRHRRRSRMGGPDSRAQPRGARRRRGVRGSTAASTRWSARPASARPRPRPRSPRPSPPSMAPATSAW